MNLSTHLAALDERESARAAQTYRRKKDDYSVTYREMHRKMQELEETYGPCSPSGWDVTKILL